jgi:hypothetical protein
MKCPFKKITQTEITYKSAYVTESPKPHKIERKENFGECDGMACRAYNAGVCVKLGC